MFQDGSQQGSKTILQCRATSSYGLVLCRNQVNFAYSNEVCETFKFRSQAWQTFKPSKPTIMGMVNKFLETGSVLDVHRSGRKKTGRSTANIDKIRRAILKSPKRSVHRLSTEHKVKRSTIHNILRKDLKKFPYKVHIKQKIKAVDK